MQLLAHYTHIYFALQDGEKSSWFNRGSFKTMIISKLPTCLRDGGTLLLPRDIDCSTGWPLGTEGWCDAPESPPHSFANTCHNWPLQTDKSAWAGLSWSLSQQSEVGTARGRGAAWCLGPWKQTGGILEGLLAGELVWDGGGGITWLLLKVKPPLSLPGAWSQGWNWSAKEIILAQSSWLCFRIETGSQRCFYVKTCLKSLTVVHLFQSVAAEDAVQMGNDIWELEDKLHFLIKMCPLCSAACCSWLWDASDDACIHCDALSVTQQAVVSCILWEFVKDAACYFFSKTWHTWPSVRCPCRQHSIRRRKSVISTYFNSLTPSADQIVSGTVNLKQMKQRRRSKLFAK